MPSATVREMFPLGEVSAVPNAPAYVRGVINLRGNIMPLIDLRMRLGHTSASAEVDAFCGMMVQREQDHRNWLAELEASVNERREFKLTTDPHKCAFGRWYDSYQPENAWVAVLLKKFDLPHQQIHGAAIQIRGLVDAGEYQKAVQLIQSTRQQVLSTMIKLFADLKNLVREVHREIAVVVTVSSKTFAVSVDSAESVEKLVAGSVTMLPAAAISSEESTVQRSGRTRDDQLVLIIETDRISSSAA